MLRQRLSKGWQRSLALSFIAWCCALSGCGGSAPAAESPADEAASGDESASTEPAAGDAPAGGDAADESAAKDDTPASAEDLKTVLQLVLDDETLDPFLKLEEPGRFPLAISGPNLPEGLTKSSKPVKIVEGAGSKKEAVLAFTEIDVKGKHATVRYRYAIEGIQGSAVLDKRDHGWELTRSKVIER